MGEKFFQRVPVRITAKRRCGGSIFNEPCPPFFARIFSPNVTLYHHHTVNTTSPSPNFTMPIEMPSFYERGQSIVFDQPTSQRGYLPQVNEKLGQWISWDVVQVGGDAHLPIFACTPGGCVLSRPHRTRLC